MKASALKQFLNHVEEDIKHSGRTLDDVDVNFRYHNDSEVYRINHVEEDLFDPETNSIIESIVLKVEQDFDEVYYL